MIFSIYNMERNIAFIGDIHGAFRTIEHIIHGVKGIRDTDFFQVGDFGIGFHKPNFYEYELQRLSNKLKKFNNNMYVIRGNHDDPDYFDGNTVYSNLKLLKDCEVINIQNLNILPLGGAISIDRKWRWSKMSDKKIWWENEVLCDCDLNDIPDVDIVVSHTAPDFVIANIGSNLSNVFEVDKKLKIDLKNEHEKMTQYFNILKNKNVKYWFFGHFHGVSNLSHNIMYFDDVKFKFCDINEIYELKKYN